MKHKASLLILDKIVASQMLLSQLSPVDLKVRVEGKQTVLATIVPSGQFEFSQ
jgi:hypothetical protein